MTGLELLEKYPLATEVVKEWILQELIKTCENDDKIPKEFKEFIFQQGVELKKIAEIIDANPRMLFDVFDENDIIALIKYHDNYGFTYVVDESEENPFYKTRKEAESQAIEEAFSILDEKEKEEYNVINEAESL